MPAMQVEILAQSSDGECSPAQTPAQWGANPKRLSVVVPAGLLLAGLAAACWGKGGKWSPLRRTHEPSQAVLGDIIVQLGHHEPSQGCQECKLATKLRFNSHSRRTLTCSDGGEVGLDMHHGTKEEFTLTNASYPLPPGFLMAPHATVSCNTYFFKKYFITNSEGKQLTDDNGVLKFVDNKGLWESWKITDAQSGQSFVQSHRGYYLGDLHGVLHLERRAGGGYIDRPTHIDKWWVHDIEGKPACTVA